MDGEDAHRVVVGLREHGLDDSGAFCALEVGPAQEVAQATTTSPAGRGAAHLREGAGLVDHEADPAPQVARTPVGERDLEHAALAHDAVEQLARTEPQPRRRASAASARIASPTGWSCGNDSGSGAW